MNEKEQQIQEALGSFEDFVKCPHCGHIARKFNTSYVMQYGTQIVHDLYGESEVHYTGEVSITYTCNKCGEKFEGDMPR